MGVTVTEGSGVITGVAVGVAVTEVLGVATGVTTAVADAVSEVIVGTAAGAVFGSVVKVPAGTVDRTETGSRGKGIAPPNFNATALAFSASAVSPID